MRCAEQCWLLTADQEDYGDAHWRPCAPPCSRLIARSLVSGESGAPPLERVMNSIRIGLEMGKTEVAKEPSRPWNPHFYAVFAQVHNTL
jgi:hypothetical protein